ncbi:hypothetical protein [uncultured Kordia sp.]|uniref:hypothetical protein n=1 Tax=uncultured Kordia sp. TaxID=507699 RepID=UPI0026063805|nr:hypothetical protein [uncultured Kordia sp.]
MDRIVDFFDMFFKAEVEVLEAYKLPDLDAYNSKVDLLGKYLVPELKNSFGAKMNSLMDEEFYERVKNYPKTNERHLFRIDEYRNSIDKTVFLCMISEPDASKSWKELDLLLVIEIENNDFKIVTKFFLTNSHELGHPVWNSGGGKKDYEKIVNGEYLLNEKSLGKCISTKRLMEPIDDEVSMIIYNNDEI